MSSSVTILYVEAVLALPVVMLGLNHILQPTMWIGFFARLAERETDGVLIRTFLFEIWPATLIVVLHQDWTWPGIVVTLYGHLLLVKVAVSLLRPELGLKSPAQAAARSLSTRPFLTLTPTTLLASVAPDCQCQSSRATPKSRRIRIIGEL